MTTSSRLNIVDSLQIGAAEVWRAHPYIATPNHTDANYYIVNKEIALGSPWANDFHRLRDTVISRLYLKCTGSEQLSFRSGMAAGLYIIDQSHFFQGDALPIVRGPIDEKISACAKQTKAETRRRLFEFAMAGLDVIHPLFAPTASPISPERLIRAGSRNQDFEMGVGVMLRAAILGEYSASPGRISL